jgi:hypothetical protein
VRAKIGFVWSVRRYNEAQYLTAQVINGCGLIYSFCAIVRLIFLSYAGWWCVLSDWADGHWIRKNKFESDILFGPRTALCCVLNGRILSCFDVQMVIVRVGIDYMCVAGRFVSKIL